MRSPRNNSRSLPSLAQARLRHARALLAVVLGAGAVPACNWMTFADDAAKAPVRSIASPDSFKSGDFGQLLVPLSNGLGKSAAFIATSINDSNILVVTVDAAGSVTSLPVPKTALDDTRDSPVTSIAEVPDSNPMRIIFGTPELTGTGFGRVYTYLLTPALDGAANPIVLPGFLPEEPGMGRALAVGRLGGAENVPDYVVAADDRMGIAVDVANGAPVAANGTTTVGGAAGCDVVDDPAQEARYKVRRPLLTARLWDDPPGTKVQQVILGATHAASPGKLSFFSVTGAATAPSLNCLTSVSAPAPGMKAQFGRALAVGDFNNDMVKDLLVGAPGQEAYVFIGPFPAGGVPTPILISNPGGGDIDFGFAVTALNVDGIPGDEALIADPRATVGGQEKAGRVLAFAWDAASRTMKLTKTYSDHAPESNAGFGTTVNALNFCTDVVAGAPCAAAASTRLLLIGASNEVFLYFREGDNIPLRLRDGKMIADARTP
ncbi:MAG: integrin alpha [Pseudomonadota bacterium]